MFTPISLTTPKPEPWSKGEVGRGEEGVGLSSVGLGSANHPLRHIGRPAYGSGAPSPQGSRNPGHRSLKRSAGS